MAVLKYSGSRSAPIRLAGSGEVLVRVAATSVNPIDYKRRAGLTKDFYPIKFPGLMGVDLAGTVVKIGPGVEGFSGGDQVFAMAADTYAELCVVKAASLAKVPEGLDQSGPDRAHRRCSGRAPFWRAREQQARARPSERRASPRSSRLCSGELRSCPDPCNLRRAGSSLGRVIQ
ncbi:MAG: alcohol dehydrogenase catalytic domain-containing protein [Candidatus Sulfotelmatobacter sp.]|jgi:D-arabinose 1-dehydrogenase-like Zn-dependent alcohol dehydrogenase